MPRIRSIKPEFFSDPKPARCSREARLLFLGILTEADDDGRLLATPKRLAGNLYPHDPDVTAAKVTRWLGELEQVGMVYRYTVDGAEYLHVCTFGRHQKISHKTESRLPPPPDKSPDPNGNGSGKTPEKLQKNSGAAPESFRPDLGSGSRNREQGARSRDLVATDKPPRRANPTWDTLAALFGNPQTSPERSLLGKVAKELAAAGAIPEEIRDRADEYARRFPTMAFTPTALLKHWTSLGIRRVVPTRGDQMSANFLSRIEGMR